MFAKTPHPYPSDFLSAQVRITRDARKHIRGGSDLAENSAQADRLKKSSLLIPFLFIRTMTLLNGKLGHNNSHL